MKAPCLGGLYYQINNKFALSKQSSIPGHCKQKSDCLPPKEIPSHILIDRNLRQ